MASYDSEALVQALSNANVHLRKLQLLPSCSAEVQEAAEDVSLELVKALSLVSRSEAAQRLTPPPVEAVPVTFAPFDAPSPLDSPPLPPDTPAAAPLPLAAAVRAATELTAAADDFVQYNPVSLQVALGGF